MTKVNYIPYGKNILIKEYKEPEILVPKKEKIKITSIHDISDKDLLDLGLNTKGAMTANRSTEDQDSFVIVAVGPKVDSEEAKIGDRILLKHAAQPTGIQLDGKIYGQVEEFWIAGRLV